MFFKLIDKYTVEKAPKPLKIGGKDVFTNSEEVHNNQGFFKVVNSEYPEGDKTYRPIYAMGEGAIMQTFEEVTASEVDEV